LGCGCAKKGGKSGCREIGGGRRDLRVDEGRRTLGSMTNAFRD